MTAESASGRPWWAGLGVKLFASYLTVVAIGIGTLVVAAGLATPSIFDLHIAQMMGNSRPGRGSGMGMGPGQVMTGGGNPQVVSPLDTALADAFRASLGQGLLVGGAAAVITAIGASLLVSRRIASPVITLARASHRIAEGHYAERVGVGGSDELGELCRSFNSMAAALGATEQRRAELIGDVAHELRTPLATLRGYLEGLMDGVVAPSDQTWARLHAETGRLQRLVDDLQELSRAEAGQLMLHPRPLDAARLAQDAVERLGPAYAEKGIRLETDLAAGLPTVVADAVAGLRALLPCRQVTQPSA